MARTATATTSLAQVAWCINRIEGLKSEVDELDAQVVQDVEDYHALQRSLARLERLRSVELTQRCRGIELDSQTLDAGPSRFPSTAASSHGVTQLSEKARGKLRSNTDELALRLIEGQRQFERDLKRVDVTRRKRNRTPPEWGQEAASLLERVLSLQWRDYGDDGEERPRRGAKETQQRLVEALLEDHTLLPTLIAAIEASGGSSAVLNWVEGLVVALLSSPSSTSASNQREVDDLILALFDALQQTRLSILATTSSDHNEREAVGPYFDPLRPTRKLELALLGFVGRERKPTSTTVSPLKSPLTMKKPQPLPPQYLPSSTIVHLRQRTISTPTQPPPAMSSFSVLGNSASQLWNDTTSTLSGFFGTSTPFTAQSRSVSLGLPATPSSESEEGKENKNVGKSNDEMQVKKGGRQRVVSMTTAGSPPQRILPLSNVDEDDAKASFSSFANGSDARTALGHLTTPSMVLDRRRRARVISDAQHSQVEDAPNQQQQTPPRQRTSSLINKSQIVKLPTPIKSPTKVVIDESEESDSQEDDIWVERILAVLAPSTASQSNCPLRVSLVVALARRLLQHHFDAQNHAALHRRLALIVVVRWFGFTQLRSLLTRPDVAGRSLRHPPAPLHLGGGLLSESGDGQESGLGETSEDENETVTDEGPQTATMEGVWMPQLADDLDALHRRVYQAITRVMDAGRETGGGSDKGRISDEVARRIVEAFGVGVGRGQPSRAIMIPAVENDSGKIKSSKNGAIAALNVDRVHAKNLVQLLSSVDECEDGARSGPGEASTIFFARQNGKILVDVGLQSIEARMARRQARREGKQSEPQKEGRDDNNPPTSASNASAAVAAVKGQILSVVKPRSASVTTNGINSHVFPSSLTNSSGSVLSVASNSSSGTATYGNGAAAASSSSRMERSTSNSSWGSPPSSPYHQGLAGASGVGYFDLDMGANTQTSPTSPVNSPLQRRVSASRARAPPTAWRAMGAAASAPTTATTIASPLPIEPASTSVPTASETVFDEASLPLNEIRKGIIGLVRGPYRIPLHRELSLIDVLSMAADTARRSFAHDDAALLDQTRNLIVEAEPAAQKVIPDLFVRPLRTSLTELQRRKAGRERQRWRISRQRVRLLDDAMSVYARMHELRARAWYASEVRLAMGVRRARQVALDNLLLSHPADHSSPLAVIREKKKSEREEEEDVETGREWLARQAIYDMGLQSQYDVDYLRDLDRAFSDIIAGDAASFFASSKVWMREETIARPYMLGPSKSSTTTSDDGEGSNPVSDEEADEDTDKEEEVVLGFGACSRRMLPQEQRRTERRRKGKSIQALEDFLQRVQLLVTGLFLSEAMVPLQQSQSVQKREVAKTTKEEGKDQEHGPNDEVARRILASSSGKEGLDELLYRFERHPSPREKMRCALVIERLVVTHLEAHRRQVAMQKRLALKEDSKPQFSLRQREDARHQRRVSRAGTDSTPMRPLSVQSSLNGTGRPRRALSMYGDDDWEQQIQHSSPSLLPNLPTGQIAPLGIDDILSQMNLVENPVISPVRSYSGSQQQTSYDSDSSSSSSSSAASASTVTAAAAVAASPPALDPARSLSPNRADSETQQGYAPSTDDIVATLESLLRLRHSHSLSSSSEETSPLQKDTSASNKDSERDMRLALQIVAAFTPTDVLDRRDEGKAFWDLALAALAAASDTS